MLRVENDKVEMAFLFLIKDVGNLHLLRCGQIETVNITFFMGHYTLRELTPLLAIMSLYC